SLGEELTASPSYLDHSLSHLARAAGAFRSGDHALALRTLDTLVQLPGKDGGLLVSFAQRIRALTMARLGDPNASIADADSGLVLARKWALTQDEAILLVLRSEALIQKDDLDNALLDLTQADRICRNNGHMRASALTKNALGLLYFKQNRYPEARSRFLEALSIARSQGAKKIEQSALSNLGSVAIMSGELQQGLFLCDSLLSIADENDTDLRARVLGLRGVIQTRMGDLDMALGTLTQAMNLKERLHDKAGKVKIQQHMATALWESGQPHRSQDILHDALEGAIQLGDGDLQAQIHWALQDHYKTLDKIDLAYEHLLWYVGLSDSLSAAQFDARVAIHETRLGAEQKEHRLAEQKQALALAATEDRRKSIQRNALLGATIASLLIAFLLYRSMRNRQHLARKEKELHHEQVDQLLSQQEIKSINAMLEGQEKERDRMAKDLHDRLGSMLGGIKANMSALEDRVEQMRQDQQYQKVNRLLDQTVSELRQISHDMAAATLSRFGLEKALKDLRDTIHINGRLAVELKIFGLDQRLERSVELAVYRIVQELVSNVLKHAQARELSIDVTRTPGRLSVVVADDGAGFNTASHSDGMGLTNVRSRASAIGATVHVDSTPGKGTTVSVECPVVE
ncbi:MAG TPA: sensor histidine kinase, partial [Flavobacteriales bacterium]|nr:sensor histidine kinase [Flavobacteriales bacterium]